MSEIEHLVMPALRAAGRPTTYENQERMRKALTEAAHARAEAVGLDYIAIDAERCKETMIEKVARAIALAALDDETRAVVDPDAYPVVDSYYDLARAAIEAMRDV